MKNGLISTREPQFARVCNHCSAMSGKDINGFGRLIYLREFQELDIIS